jgi:hypothetical protein
MLHDPLCGHGLGFDASSGGAKATFGHYGQNRGLMCRVVATVEGRNGVVTMSNSNYFTIRQFDFDEWLLNRSESDLQPVKVS